MTETLFSLEVHVESVEGLRLPCNLPALCFRLLDFPTLIVHHVSPLQAEKLRQKVRLEDNKSTLVSLKDRHGNFQFQKGKSCLFKAHIDTLLVQLQSVPLYTMLMDLWPGKPVLLGSTFIPLKKAINQISADVLEKGVAVPLFYRDDGNFELFNLMGSPIAKARIGYRLLSLGGSLLPHIPPEAFGSIHLNRVESLETDKEAEQEIKGAVEKLLPQIDENVPQAERNGTRYSRTEGGEIGNVGKSLDKHSVETQTHLHVGKVRDCRIIDHEGRQDKDEVLITNTICPPPLYFNLLSHSQVQNGRSNSTKQEVVKRTGIGNTLMQKSDCVDDDGDVDLVYYDPGLLREDGSVGVTSVSVQTEGGFPSRSSVPESSRDNGDLLGLKKIAGITSEGQLPILNALLQEIMYIAESQKDLTQSKDASTNNYKKPIIPKCRRRADEGRIPDSKAFYKVSPDNVPVKLENAPKQENNEKLKLMHSGKKLSTSVIRLSNKRVRFKKTNLTYGTTRTQRMRLEINQKDKLPERRRPCEYAATAKKNTYEEDSLKTLDLGKTYKIRSAKTETATVGKDKADAWVQTQQLPEEGQQLEEKAVVEQSGKPNLQGFSPDGSARSLKSQTSLEVFIPQVQGELEDKSDHGEEWATDHPPHSYYGHTGLNSIEAEDSRRASAMTMYSEDFEDSQDGSQQSLHSASSKSSSRESIKDRSRNSDVSTNSSLSCINSVSSDHERPIKSSHSPVKTKSAKLRTRVEQTKEDVKKTNVHKQDDTEVLEQKTSHHNQFSAESEDHNDSGENYLTDDFHLTGSDQGKSDSDDDQH